MPITESECQKRLAVASQDIGRFYKEDLLIYKGVTSDSKKLYNEVAAAYLCNNLLLFEQIVPFVRKEKYLTNIYKQYDRNQSNKNTHKQLVLKLFRQKEFEQGVIVDCFTPLLDRPSNKELSKLDLLLKTSANELIVLNVKLANSEQSLLRYLVELITLYRRLDQEKLLNELGLENYTIRFAPLLFRKSAAYQQLKEDRYWLYRFMDYLDVDIFIIDQKRSGFQISRQHFSSFASPMIKEKLDFIKKM